MNLKSKKLFKIISVGLAVVLWLIVWELVALIVGNRFIFPGATQSIAALSKFFIALDFWKTVLASILRILAGFDCNDTVLEISNNKSVLPIKEIKKYCTDHDVRIGIITVGQGSAQEVCDRLIACGIKAIWNFAPCTLTVPDDVILKQENLALSLAHLNSQLKIKK